MAKLDLASSEWCQQIFEGKNQAYGAYRMRANSPKRHTVAMLIVVAIAIVGFTIPTLLIEVVPSERIKAVLDDPAVWIPTPMTTRSSAVCS